MFVPSLKKKYLYIYHAYLILQINNLLQPSNLQNDVELTSAIVNNNLPVSKIVNKLKSITSDIDIITDILSKCEFCVLSGDKSTVTVKRSVYFIIIIIRRNEQQYYYEIQMKKQLKKI